MTDDERTLITCRADLDHARGYESFQDLVDLLEDQTDLEVEVDADDTMLTIAQGLMSDNGYNAMSFVYPFVCRTRSTGHTFSRTTTRFGWRSSTTSPACSGTDRTVSKTTRFSTSSERR